MAALWSGADVDPVYCHGAIFIPQHYGRYQSAKCALRIVTRSIMHSLIFIFLYLHCSLDGWIGCVFVRARAGVRRSTASTWIYMKDTYAAAHWMAKAEHVSVRTQTVHPSNCNGFSHRVFRSESPRHVHYLSSCSSFQWSLVILRDTLNHISLSIDQSGDSGGPLNCRLHKNGPWVLAGMWCHSEHCTVLFLPIFLF